MITVRQLRELDVEPCGTAPGIRYVSAASGMVMIGKLLYVIADDELHLGVFDSTTSAPGRRIRLMSGELPDSPRERKAMKPDFEALVRLPAFEGYRFGALLALPSGSRPNRRTGVAWALDADDRLGGEPRQFDLTRFYAKLEESITGLNIEGAVVLGKQLVLLHRGGKMQPQSALAYLSLPELQAAISADGQVAETPTIEVRFLHLGQIAGATLAFTDGAALPDGRIVFSAVAENTEDSYLDGPCVGAAIGILGPDGDVQRLERLEPVEKIEGIHVKHGIEPLEILLVTDADDAAVPAKLLTALLPTL